MALPSFPVMSAVNVVMKIQNQEATDIFFREVCVCMWRGCERRANGEREVMGPTPCCVDWAQGERPATMAIMGAGAWRLSVLSRVLYAPDHPQAATWKFTGPAVQLGDLCAGVRKACSRETRWDLADTVMPAVVLETGIPTDRDALHDACG